MKSSRSCAEPDRGGAGPIFGLDNFENINAHAMVLPGSPLLKASFERGHINRPVTATFPGPGRAYVQWGVSCYQPGWEDVFVQGDLDAGTAWLLDAINGKVDTKTTELEAKIKVAEAKKTELPSKFAVGQEIKLYDTPVGVGSSPDGKTTYVLLYDGSVTAYGPDGKEQWHTQALLEGCNLAVSPKGDRVAVAGYPGLLVLDARDGKVLGGYRAAPYAKGEVPPADKMLAAAWNDKGTLVAAGWAFPNPKAPEPAVVLDADGKEVSRPTVHGPVMGVAFAPGTDTLLIGADRLTAVDAKDGKTLWTNPIKGRRRSRSAPTVRPARPEAGARTPGPSPSPTARAPRSGSRRWSAAWRFCRITIWPWPCGAGRTRCTRSATRRGNRCSSRGSASRTWRGPTRSRDSSRRRRAAKCGCSTPTVSPRRCSTKPPVRRLIGSRSTGRTFCWGG